MGRARPVGGHRSPAQFSSFGEGGGTVQMNLQVCALNSIENLNR